MRLWPRTLRGRTIALVAIGALVSHLIGLALYAGFNASELSAAREQVVVERLATAAKSLERLSLPRREEIVAELSEPGFQLQLGEDSHVAPADSGEEDTQSVRANLALALAMPADTRVFADYELPIPPGFVGPLAFDADPQRAILAERVAQWFRFREDLFISLRLSDGQWLNARVRGRPGELVVNDGLLWSLALVALTVSILTAWAVARPLAGLKRVARAAEALGVDVGSAPPLPEAGLPEIARTARAFNRMSERIRTLIEDRTRMFAAMSHDLRTPLTRMRLRAEFVEQPEQRERMLRDIAAMETMVSVSLRYLRDGMDGETRERIDFVGFMVDLCLDMDLDPPEFRLQGARRIRVEAAPVALRRAFANVLDNARQYGNTVEVRVSCRDRDILVEVADRGPGIAIEERENVFKPYYRLDPSRNERTGGSGLGLAIARSTIRAHGGDIELAEREGGGLVVRIVLPLTGHPARSANA